MQSLKNYYSKDSLELLLEKAIDRYMQMVNRYPDIKNNPEFRTAVEEAIRILKKDDRIVWWVHWLKLKFLKNLNLGTEGLPILQNEFKYYSDKTGKSVDELMAVISAYVNLHVLNRLDHYFSMHIPVIDNKVFSIKETPVDVVNAFSAEEKKYYDQFEGAIEANPYDEIILQFQDGWVWANTHSPTCSTAERKSMQHCGNEYGHKKEGDEIFSLREPVVIGQTKRWRPHLTFVVNDGTIREAKGKQNAKPVEKYHQYIVPLIKSDAITKIDCSGSYSPQNNFSIKDLPDKTQREIEELKGDDFETDELAQMGAKLEELQTYYNGKLKHSSINYDLADGEYYYVDGYLSFDFGDLDFTKKWTNLWEASDHYQQVLAIKNDLLKIIDNIYGETELESDHMYIDVRDESGYSHDAEKEMDSIGEDLVRYEDNHYDEDYAKIVKYFIENGFVRPKEYQKVLNEIKDNFEHFEVDDYSTGTISITFNIATISAFDQDQLNKLTKYLKDMKLLDKLIKKEFIVKKDDKRQLKFSFKESVDRSKIFDDVLVRPETHTENAFAITFYINNFNKLKDKQVNEMFQIMQYVETNYDSIKKSLEDVAYHVLGVEKAGLPIGFTSRARFKDWYSTQLAKTLK